MSTKELKIIREEIKELWLLYKNLLDSIVPLEEPTTNDKLSIERKERVVNVC